MAFDWKWYKRTTALKMRGMVVYSLREFSNNLVSLPEGTAYTVLGKGGGGLEVRSFECPKCGVRWRWKGIPPTVVCDELEAIELGLVAVKASDGMLAKLTAEEWANAV